MCDGIKDVNEMKIDSQTKEIDRLKNDLRVAQAQDIGTLSKAIKNMSKTENYNASAIIIQITDLSGEEVILPFAISDGLSSSAMIELRNEIKRTLRQRLSMNNIDNILKDA